MPTLQTATSSDLKAAVPSRYAGVKAKILAKGLKRKMGKKRPGRAGYTG